MGAGELVPRIWSVNLSGHRDRLESASMGDHWDSSSPHSAWLNRLVPSTKDEP